MPTPTAQQDNAPRFWKWRKKAEKFQKTPKNFKKLGKTPKSIGFFGAKSLRPCARSRAVTPAQNKSAKNHLLHSQAFTRIFAAVLCAPNRLCAPWYGCGFWGL